MSLNEKLVFNSSEDEVSSDGSVNTGANLEKQEPKQQQQQPSAKLNDSFNDNTDSSDVQLKQIVSNLESALNDSLNDSDLVLNQNESLLANRIVEAVLEESSSSLNESLSEPQKQQVVDLSQHSETESHPDQHEHSEKQSISLNESESESHSEILVEQNLNQSVVSESQSSSVDQPADELNKIVSEVLEQVNLTNSAELNESLQSEPSSSSQPEQQHQANEQSLNESSQFEPDLKELAESLNTSQSEPAHEESVQRQASQEQVQEVSLNESVQSEPHQEPQESALEQSLNESEQSESQSQSEPEQQHEQVNVQEQSLNESVNSESQPEAVQEQSLNESASFEPVARSLEVESLNTTQSEPEQELVEVERVIELNNSNTESVEQSDLNDEDVQKVVADLNQSLNENSVSEPVSEPVQEQQAHSEPQPESESESENKTLSQIVGDIISPLTNLLGFGSKQTENLSKIVNDIYQNDNDSLAESEQSVVTTLETTNAESEPALTEERAAELTDVLRVVTSLASAAFEPEPESQPEQQQQQPESAESAEDLELKSNVALRSLEANLPDQEPEVAVCTGLYQIVYDELLEKKADYLNTYKLSEAQFDLVREFYLEKRDGAYLNNSLLRILMNESIKERKEVNANEQDVSRALETVDENKDDKITFDEFLRLLLLFFSSKNNLSQRISNVLRSKFSSESLTSSEAVEFSEFLNNFYGRLEQASFEDSIQPNEFVNQVVPGLESSAFVRFEEPQPEAAQVQPVQEATQEEPVQQPEQESN